MYFPSCDKTKRIWLNEAIEKNTYAEFIGQFRAKGEPSVRIRIACDSVYALWINDVAVSFSCCGDYPWYKLYDDIDITQYVAEENHIRLQIWYLGEDSQTYIAGEPGLVFEITQGEDVLCRSDETILSARVQAYRRDCHIITSQLGFSFFYDNTKKQPLQYRTSATFPAWDVIVARGITPLVMKERCPITVYPQRNGYLIDMGEETVGFLELELESDRTQDLLIRYGERLIDGNVPQLIGDRNFSVGFRTAVGTNRYQNPFRRLAGRYMQVICEEPIRLHYLGLRPVERTVTEKTAFFASPLDQKIYDVSVNTLRKCMHEHYEDCPWREQAMYTMDSRNQMLCGYYAFEETDFPRNMILLMAQGQHEDGLLSLCYPAGVDYPIPFFSLVYFMILEEYVEHTSDRSILHEVENCAEKIMNAFAARIDENHLIARLPYPYWNFYEWAEESHREHEITRKPSDPYEKSYDLILNAMYVYASRIYERLYNKTIDTDEMCTAIHEAFYVKERGLYRLSTSGMHFSVLGNSMALLIGMGDRTIADKLLQDKTLIPVTLSMSAFYYDALLRFGDVYCEDILRDIRVRYGKMLEAGATTCWETDTSIEDGLAWSQCHGWSAIPVFYLRKLLRV